MIIFGKLQKAEIEAMQVQGDFWGGDMAVRKVAGTKNQRLMGTMGKSRAIIPDMKTQFKIHYCVWRIPFMDVPETKRFWGYGRN